MVEKVVKAYPNVKVVGTTLREVKSGLVNNWSAILWHEGTFYESRRFDGLEIEDRVGGGDGFSSGFAYGFLGGKSAQECVDWARRTERCCRPRAATAARLIWRN
jgi:2-dehydro-3-deoxygluconokinase